MAITYSEDGKKKVRKGNKKPVNMANMPDYIFESIQRQYGNKKYGEYTIEDKKNVIDYYKKKNKKGKV